MSKLPPNWCIEETCGRRVWAKGSRCKSCSNRARPKKPKKPKSPRVRPTMPCEGNCGRLTRVRPVRADGLRRLCRECSALRLKTDPEVRRRNAETVKARFKDPEYLARHIEVTRAGKIARLAIDPEFRERLRAHGRKIGKSGAGNRARPKGHPARKRAGQKAARKKLAWCPEAYLPLYRSLRLQEMSAAAAREAVLSQIEVDRRRVMRGGLVDQSTFIKVREAAAWLKERAGA